MLKPFFPNNPNTPVMLAEVAAHQVRPEKDMPDVDAVVLAFAYDQETDPGNTGLVDQWIREFPAYARELHAVSYARTAMGWRIDDDILDDGLEDFDANAETEEAIGVGREIVAALRTEKERNS